VQHAGLNDCQRPNRLDRLRKAFDAVAPDDAGVLDAMVLDLGQHLQLVLGALTTGADSPPGDVALTIHGQPDECVDGLVRDLAVAALHGDRVHEDHRIHAIQRGRQPSRGERDDHRVHSTEPALTLPDRLGFEAAVTNSWQLSVNNRTEPCMRPIGVQSIRARHDCIAAARARARRAGGCPIERSADGARRR